MNRLFSGLAAFGILIGAAGCGSDSKDTAASTAAPASTSAAAIATTAAQPKEFIDYGTPWEATTEVIGKAVGKPAEAAEIVRHVEGLYAEARSAHPEFAGKTASVDFFYNDSPGAYASQDGRSR